MKNSCRMIYLLVCLFLLSIPLASASNIDISNTKSTARTEIWKDINSGAAGSTSIAIMDDGKIVYSESFGMADREKSIPVDKNTLFNIGSVSKMYVTTAIMLLVDDGKINLDHPITHYLPEFSMADERYKDITVRMTLNHTSGLPGTTGENNFGFVFNKDIYQDVLAVLARSNLKHRPGEMAPYCNDGFTVAEMIVAKVSGENYLDFLTNRIFKPLSLHDTGPSVGQWQIGKEVRLAKVYPLDKKHSDPLEVLSVLGAGGLAASAEDLCRFADTFSGKGVQILSTKSLMEMKKAQPAAFYSKLRSPDISFGLGWDITDLKSYKDHEIKILGKGGNSGTYTSQLFTLPDQRISIAIVSTGKASNTTQIADNVLTTYLTDKGLLTPAISTVTPPLKAQPIPMDLKTFEGYYFGGQNLLRIAFDMEKGIMTMYKVEGKTETPQLVANYNSGYFYNDQTKLYFMTIDGTSYLVTNVAILQSDAISCEKIQPIVAPKQLAVAINGQKWLRRNVKPFEGMLVAPDHIIKSQLIDALPGYIDFGGIKKVESPTFASMIVKSSRDLTELRLVEKEGQLWAWIGGSIFMSADKAERLTADRTIAVLGANGYNQWLIVSKDCVLNSKKPKKARMIVFAPDDKILYDSAVDRGEVFAPAGSFIELSGNPGDIIHITANFILN